MGAAREALRHAPFGRLFAGYTVNQVGDYIGIVALSVLVYSETKSALATSGLFIAIQFVPALVAPALTARIDGYALSRSLPLLYAAEAALFAVLALLAENFVLWLVLFVAFLDGTLMLTARGLLRGGVNEVLEPVGLLRQGNGILNVGFALAGIGGAALGGVLVDAWGVAVALLVDAGSFVIIAVLLAGTGLRGRHATREPLGRRLLEGFDYAWKNTALRLLIVGEAFAIVLFAGIFPIEVIYATQTLGTDETGYGIMLASWGAGMLIGSALFLGSKRSLFRLIAFSTLAIGLAYFGMGTVRELWAACLLSVLGGCGNGVQWVSVMTAVQEATSSELQARVAGLLESAASAATGIGFLAGGILTSLTAPETAFLVAGSGVIVIVAVGSLVALWRGPRRGRSAGRDAAHEISS